jgi:hypothetical protein
LIAADVTAIEPTAIEPMSPAADASAVGVPPAARTYYEGCAEAIAIASAITSTAAIDATATAAIDATAAHSSTAAASAAAGQRRRGRSADQNGRGAGHVDEQQS